MMVAVAGAVGIGEWFEAATVAFLFALSLALESWSVGRARRAVAALLDLAPRPSSRVQDAGGEREVSAGRSVPIGSPLRRAGPASASRSTAGWSSGASDVNQAPITGESVPVAKEAGDEVFAGTINGDGALEVESTRRAGDTTLAHIIRMVGDAQSPQRALRAVGRDVRPRLHARGDGARRCWSSLVPPLLFGGAWGDWFYRALVLLVIACPCALVISTPVSIVAALAAAAARNGVLVKGGALHRGAGAARRRSPSTRRAR